MYPIWRPFTRYNPDQRASEEAVQNVNNVNKQSPKNEHLGGAAQRDITVTRPPLKRRHAEVTGPTNDQSNTYNLCLSQPPNIIKRSRNDSTPVSISPANQRLDGMGQPWIYHNPPAPAYYGGPHPGNFLPSPAIPAVACLNRQYMLPPPISPAYVNNFMPSPARPAGSFITNYITVPASPARSCMSNALSSPASSDDQRLIIAEPQVNCTPPPSVSPAESYVSDTLRSPTSSDDRRLEIADPRRNQLLAGDCAATTPNKLLRVYLQNGPRRQLRKFTFVMDSSLKVPFALDKWNSDNPVIRISERRYNTIFTEYPTKRRIFKENGVLNLKNPSVKKMALNGSNTPTCRQRNRILTALDEIEYFLACAVVKEQARLATRSITLVNVLVNVWRADGPTFKILQAELARLYADQTI